MGLFKTLFGGSEEKSSSTPTKVNVLDPSQQSIMDWLGPMLRGEYEGGDNNDQLSDLELTSLQGLEGLANNLVSGAGQNSNNILQQTLNELLQSKPSDINSYLDDTVDDPMMEELFQKLIPYTENKYAGNQNFFGGERVGAVNDQIDGTVRNITRARSEAAIGEFNNARNARLTALGLAPDVQTAPIRNLAALLEAGGVANNRKQQGLDNESRRVEQLLAFIGLPTNQVAQTAQSKSDQQNGIFKSINLF